MGSAICSSCKNGSAANIDGGTASPSPPSTSAREPFNSSSRTNRMAGQNPAGTMNNNNSNATTTTTNTNSTTTAAATVAMDETMRNATLVQQVSMALATVQRLGINLLAIDFDQTIINIHTGGQWKGNARELARHVRPEFQELFHQVQQLENLDICIVTFSPQVKLIRHVVEEGTTWNFADQDKASGNRKRLPLVIRGGDRSWSYVGAGSLEGKQPHMASAVEELESEHERNITKQTTLLIDDDSKNVRCALRDGVRAIWFNPRRPQDLLPDMIRLV